MSVWDYPETGDAWIASESNEERAEWAMAAVVTFRDECRGDFDLTAIYDLIGNLGHLFDQLAATHDLSDEMMPHATFDEVVGHGLTHYHAERGEGDDIEQGMRAES